MDTEKIEKIKRIINEARAKNRFVSVDFVKKSGEARHMVLGRSRRLEGAVSPSRSESVEARKWTLTARGMLCVEELTPQHTAQWRTINLNTVTRIKADGTETTFD